MTKDSTLIHNKIIPLKSFFFSQEARNLPLREYVNQPCDIFFTLEIQPKNPNSGKPDAMRYRFVTKTLKKAADICDFSEKFLAQLSKSSLKVCNSRLLLTK